LDGKASKRTKAKIELLLAENRNPSLSGWKTRIEIDLVSN
jgi:hypothetical protein